MPFVNYLEFNVPDVDAAGEFYARVFGWEPRPFADGYSVVAHGDEPGIDTGIQRHEGASGTVAVVSVESIDDTLAAVKEAGGTVVVDKFPIPEVGHAAYFVDPAGITMGVHQPQASAANSEST